MSNPSTTFQKRITLLLTEEDLAKLDQLTEKGRMSKCHVLRQLISAQHAMKIQRVPTCANGSACHCPHTHTYGPIPGGFSPPSISN